MTNVPCVFQAPRCTCSDYPGCLSLSTRPFMDGLPVDVQSRILGLLPIAALVVCKAVSRSWRSLISSPPFLDSYPRYHSRRRDDPIFLLWSHCSPTPTASAYLPSIDRWTHFHLPVSVTTGAASTEPSGVAKTLILADYIDRYAVIAPFSRDRPLHLLPPLIDPTHWHKALALIEFSPSDYTVVVVSPNKHIHTQTYDSRSGRWEQRGDIRLSSGFIDLMSAVWHQGLLFCVSRDPDHFLTFDLVTGQWTILELDFPMPSLFRSHFVGYGGELYLTAQVRDETDSRIGIWKLDQSAMAWREFDFMPDDYLLELGAAANVVVDCMGMICFGRFSSKKILMCDLAERRWWWLQPCNVPAGERPGVWVGHTIQPHIDLLK